ncbi:transcription intermediary factor 1-alpha [Astyanax mexicanus]|uniref:transcription intermediary factor 1-alpha n=1 Tax=Astyanax mexicanus TaxID=7994 RepID=UPI0020CB260A|nr:transcription intermediary factor 1-alpha [Astyanax mexicanus]
MVFSGREDEEEDGEGGRSQEQSETAAQAEEWEVCSVCRTTLNSSAAPQLLPCLHPVCKQCVTQSGDNQNSTECPVCGQTFSLSEVSDCFIFEDSAPKCGGCEDSAVSGWCEQCEEALCSDCVLAHQRVKLTRNHSVITEKPPSGFTGSLHCSSHKQERLKFFCVACDELTCRDCQLMDHRGHSFLLLEEALVSQKEQLQKLMHVIREKSGTVNASLTDMDARMKNTIQCKALAKKKLANLVQNLQVVIFFRGRQLLKEMESLYDQELTNLMKEKTTLKSLENRQLYITSFIQKILSTEGQCILLHKKQIVKRAEGLLSQKTTNLCESTLQLTLQIQQEISQICKTFGSIKAVRIPHTVVIKPTNDHDPNGAAKEYNSSVNLNNLSVETPQSLPHAGSESVPDQPQSEQTLPVPTSLNSAQLSFKAAIVSHASASSMSPLNAPVQPPQSSNTADSVPVQVTPVLPQPVSTHSICPQPTQSKRVNRSLSHPQPQTRTQFSVQGQIVSNSIIGLNHNQRMANSSSAQPTPQLLPQPVPQTGNIPVSAPHLNFKSSMSQLSTSIIYPSSRQTALSQSSSTVGTIVAQSRSVVLHPSGPVGHQSPSSVVLSAPSVQPNTLPSGQMQQSFPVSQFVSVQSAPNQCLNSNHLLQAASTSDPMPVYQGISTAQTVFLQPAQPGLVQSNPLLFTLLKNNEPMQQFATVSTVNQTPILTYAPQPSLLITAPPSVPPVAVNVACNTQNILTAAILEKSSHLVPGSSNKELATTVSSKSPLSATETLPSASSTLGQSECPAQAPQKPQYELPVQAPADSVYESNISMHSRASSPAAEEPDDNLPSSTVPETETTNLKAGREQCLSSPPTPDPICTAPALKNPPDKSSTSRPKSQLNSTLTMSSSEKASTSKHWSVGIPTSLREILEKKDDAPASEVEGVSTKEALSASDAEHTSSSTQTLKIDGAEFISDFGPVEEEEDGINEWEFELPEDYNESLQWTFASESTVPQSLSVSSGQTEEIVLQETQEEQPIQRRLRTTSQSSSSDCPPLSELRNCAVCQSVGATMICAECGRGFHAHCHVPPILSRPTQAWMCMLCQDVFNDIDPFSHDRLKEPYLSLQDQMKCEQLLLTVMCDEHSYLLYKSSKRTAGYVEFEFIRGRLLGKRTPPYRSAAELVSDLWALFDGLSVNSKKRDLVIKLQNSFRERLDVTFGKCLHASLLRTLSSEQKVAPEPKLDKEKAKSTLKRMRDFLAENSAFVPKRPRTERSSESSNTFQITED